MHTYDKNVICYHVFSHVFNESHKYFRLTIYVQFMQKADATYYALQFAL